MTFIADQIWNHSFTFYVIYTFSQCNILYTCNFAFGSYVGGLAKFILTVVLSPGPTKNRSKSLTVLIQWTS